MLRALVLATLIFVSPSTAGQAPSVLHIKVVLVDAEGQPSPVTRHALLISENPASATPRRILTSPDGTADVRLRPGNYTVESDQPVTFNGKAYQWLQMLDVVAGRDAHLELTTGNAEVVPVPAATTSTGAPLEAPLEADPSFLLPKWQDSVVALWTPTTRASGFVIGVGSEGKGLVVTNQRAIGTATSVEVQLTPTVKVAASVLASDRARDVAVLWIDPKALGSVRPVPLACGDAAKTPVTGGDEIVTIGVPLRQRKGMTSGRVTHVDAQSITADFNLPRGSAGGPVFSVRGDLIGITSVGDTNDQNSRGDARIVRTDEACGVVASAEKKMTTAAPPSGTQLPVEPLQPFPVDALRDAAKRRTGSLSPYQLSASSFDVSFLTPVLTYGAQYQAQQPRPRTTSKDTRKPEPEPTLVRPTMDFSNWSEYVMDFPPVLLVRVTPKMVEGFWTKVARGAASTQGVSIPPIKRFTSGFARLRAFCGDAEVTPIHPFTLELRVSEDNAIHEGLYVFDPGALGPQCGTVKLALYSEKEPEKGDERIVDPKVVEQIWNDFAPYRALSSRQEP
jgi:S1-C subfamily serine protease